MYQRVYTGHEELFVVHFKPVIYHMDDLLVTAKSLSTKWILQGSEHMVVTRSQVWRIWWVTEQFEFAFSNCGHGNGRGVSRCIVMVKQHSMTQLSASFLLDSWRKFLDVLYHVTTWDTGLHVWQSFASQLQSSCWHAEHYHPCTRLPDGQNGARHPLISYHAEILLSTDNL